MVSSPAPPSGCCESLSSILTSVAGPKCLEKFSTRRRRIPPAGKGVVTGATVDGLNVLDVGQAIADLDGVVVLRSPGWCRCRRRHQPGQPGVIAVERRPLEKGVVVTGAAEKFVGQAIVTLVALDGVVAGGADNGIVTRALPVPYPAVDLSILTSAGPGKVQYVVAGSRQCSGSWCLDGVVVLGWCRCRRRHRPKPRCRWSSPAPPKGIRYTWLDRWRYR